MVKWIKQYWLPLIPILVLVIIACNQMLIQKLNQMDAWKGGGFGMFSTISDRFIHIHLIHNNSFECADFPASITHTLRKLTKHPTEEKMMQLAKQLSQRTWVYKNIKPHEPSIIMIEPNQSLLQTDEVVRFDGIEIQVYNTIFDRKNTHVYPHLIRQVYYKKQ